MTKISNYTKYNQVSSRPKENVCHIQYFNPETSEIINLRAEESKQLTVRNKPFTRIDLSNISHYKAGQMHKNIANWLPHFRTFVLDMLRGGLGFIKCKSYEAAKRYSNLGGEVVMVRNSRGAVVWGVVK